MRISTVRRGSACGLHRSPRNARNRRYHPAVCYQLKTVSCIQTIVGNRPKCLRRRNEYRASCLQSVRRTALTPSVNVGVLNDRSVHANSASICDWISSNNLRLAAVVETWHNSRDCPDLIACTPPVYNYIECARLREDVNNTSLFTNHGGVCSFYHGTLHAKRIIFADYLTFEYVAVYLTGSTLTLLFIILYRPGSVTASVQFFDEISYLLEHASVYSSSLIVAGDINNHLDEDNQTQ